MSETTHIRLRDPLKTLVEMESRQRELEGQEDFTLVNFMSRSTYTTLQQISKSDTVKEKLKELEIEPFDIGETIEKSDPQQTKTLPPRAQITQEYFDRVWLRRAIESASDGISQYFIHPMTPDGPRDWSETITTEDWNYFKRYSINIQDPMGDEPPIKNTYSEHYLILTLAYAHGVHIDKMKEIKWNSYFDSGKYNKNEDLLLNSLQKYIYSESKAKDIQHAIDEDKENRYKNTEYNEAYLHLHEDCGCRDHVEVGENDPAEPWDKTSWDGGGEGEKQGSERTPEKQDFVRPEEIEDSDT